MSIFSVLNWGFVFIVELEVIAILWEAGQPRRNTDAKKHNRICICSLLSGVEECKRLFSYELNNAYLPKLFFPVHIYSGFHLWAQFLPEITWARDQGLWEDFTMDSIALSSHQSSPDGTPFTLLHSCSFTPLCPTLCNLHKWLLLWTFPHTLVFPWLYSWAIFALHRYYYDGSFLLHNDNNTDSDYCYFTYFYLFS